MNQDEIRKIQMDATAEALTAKQEFEIAEQDRKVKALAQQVKDRIDRLTRDAADVYRATSVAQDQPVNFPAGAFHHDTESIDALLQVLSQESGLLDTMRTAKQTTDGMTARYQAMIDEINAASPESGEAQVYAMPGPEGVAAGMYM